MSILKSFMRLERKVRVGFAGIPLKISAGDISSSMLVSSSSRDRLGRLWEVLVGVERI